MKFRVKFAPAGSPVHTGQVLSFEEECELTETWGEEIRQLHKVRAAGASYVETEDGLILEIVHEPGDPEWQEAGSDGEGAE